MTAQQQPPRQVDVLIIGGGPAGSALAIRLAQFGYDVCLVERAVFPRSHIGESLSPGVRLQLEMLGMGAAVAGFRQCRTALIKWESEAVIRRDFGDASGFLVDRGQFDSILLERARSLGVQVMQPAVLRRRVCHQDGWNIELESAGGKSTVEARFLADASGRAAALRGHKQRTAPRTLALYGYWRGGNLPAAPRIEAGPDCWYWGVPLPDGAYNAIVFVDAEDFRAQAIPLHLAYDALIRQSHLMAECRDAALSGPVRIADATPYLDSDSIGPRSIKVGEAAMALDPLSSSGVQKAINTALTGAVVVNTLLRCPERADAASKLYTTRLADASDRHRRWTAQYYAAVATPGAFYHARAAGAAAGPEPVTAAGTPIRNLPAHIRVALSPETKFIDEPCIVGDLVAMKRALHHPGLDRPVAFLHGWEIATLLRSLHPAIRLDSLIAEWNIPAPSRQAIATWLLEHRILEAYPTNIETRRVSVEPN
jgi:flavin-dependent dehydrogenase